MPVPLYAFAIAAFVTLVAATVQGSIGIGFAVVSVPVLSLVDPVLAPVPQLMLALPLGLVMAWRERHAVEPRGAAWVLAGRVPGALIGVGLLKLASATTLDLLIGGFVLAAVAILASGATIHRNAATELGAGVVSGVSGLVSSMSGPPLALLFRNERGATIRANLAMIFSIGVTISIVTRIAAGELAWAHVEVSAALMPSLLLGVWLSRRVMHHAEGRPLRIAVYVISTAAASGLLVRAVLSM